MAINFKYVQVSYEGDPLSLVVCLEQICLEPVVIFRNLVHLLM